MPTVLVDGVMAPVLELIDKPAGELEKTPPVVPDIVGLRGVVVNLHKVEYGYVNVAVGAAVMVTLAVALTAPQVAEAEIEYVTVYVPAVLAEGVMAPVVAFKDKPAGLAVNVPPVAPVMVGVTPVVTVLQNGDA